jgi:hypothetical protein
MVTLDRIRLTGLLTRTPASAGVFHLGRRPWGGTMGGPPALEIRLTGLLTMTLLGVSAD